MKFRQITLQQCDNEDDLYIVHKLVDCVEPRAGAVLSTKQVTDLIAQRYTKVTILRGEVMSPSTQRAQPGNLRDDEPFEMQARAVINARVREYVTGGGRLSVLAVKTGLNPRTVSRLAYYETTRPQFHTIVAICRALQIPLKIG